MNVRMSLKVLSPGVQNAEKANLSAKVSRVGGDLQQCFGAGLEQQVIEHLFVLQSQSRKIVRNRENNVEVAARKQIGCLLPQPLLTSVGLALWAVPVSTAVVRDGFVPALNASLHMTAECRRTAVPDGAQHFQLRPGKVIPIALDEAVSSYGRYR